MIPGKGKPNYSEENLPHCHFVHHKSHMYYPGTENIRKLTTGEFLQQLSCFVGLVS
jgi:hypothetical protein